MDNGWVISYIMFIVIKCHHSSYYEVNTILYLHRGYGVRRRSRRIVIIRYGNKGTNVWRIRYCCNSISRCDEIETITSCRKEEDYCSEWINDCQKEWWEQRSFANSSWWRSKWYYWYRYCWHLKDTLRKKKYVKNIFSWRDEARTSVGTANINLLMICNIQIYTGTVLYHQVPWYQGTYLVSDRISCNTWYVPVPGTYWIAIYLYVVCMYTMYVRMYCQVRTVRNYL